MRPLSFCFVLQVSTHNIHSSSEDDDFPNDMSLQQVGRNTMERHPTPSKRQTLLCDIPYSLFLQTFSDYQIQQMTANFVEQFGFHDEEFSEHDENIKWAGFSRSILPLWSLVNLQKRIG